MDITQSEPQSHTEEGPQSSESQQQPRPRKVSKLRLLLVLLVLLILIPLVLILLIVGLVVLLVLRLIVGELSFAYRWIAWVWNKFTAMLHDDGRRNVKVRGGEDR